MRRVFKGSNLVQYGIPTLLVGLVFGMGLYYFVSSGQLLNFYAKSADMKRDTNDQTVGLLNTKNLIKYKAGDLRGTAQNPVMKCSYNRCTIDYGSYILTGVPSNFEEFVESSANSGGTDEIATLILQLADQLEQKGNTAGAKEFRDLANLGHFIANIEKQIEDQAISCETNPTSSCFTNAFHTPFGGEVPQSIANYLPDFNTGAELESLLTYSRLGFAKQMGYSSFDETRNPAYAYLQLFNNIQNNPAYSSELKGITKTLSQYIEELAGGHYCTSSYLLGPGAPSNVVDIVTGDNIHSIDTTGFELDNLLKPEYSFNTTLTAALICASGQNNNSGGMCLGY